MGGLFAAVGNVSWLSHGQIEDALYRVAQGRGVLRMESGADYFIGVQDRHGEAAVGECSPGVVAAIHGVIEDPDAGALHAGYRGEQAFPTIAKWRANPGGFVADVALMVWDRRARRLEAIRGWSNTRPLFWTEHLGAILLASEIRVLLLLTNRSWVADPLVERAFLSGLAPAADLSGCIGISLAPAGKMLSFSRRGKADHLLSELFELRFTDLAASANCETSAFEPGSIAEALVAIDREQSRRGAPVYHLTSGMDSSTLVLAALESRRREGSEEKLSCYTHGFPNTSADETTRVLDFCNPRSIALSVDNHDSERIEKLWNEYSASFDFLLGPTVYTSISSAQNAAAMGRESVVCGSGGDELFSAEEALCGLAEMSELWAYRRALGRWLGETQLTCGVRSILSVKLSCLRQRRDFREVGPNGLAAFMWRLQSLSGTHAMLAAEQLHEREGVLLEFPFFRGLLWGRVRMLGELARLAKGSTKGHLNRVRSLLAGEVPLPDAAKVGLDDAIPLALRQERSVGLAPKFDRLAMLKAWRGSVRGFDPGRMCKR